MNTATRMAPVEVRLAEERPAGDLASPLADDSRGAGPFAVLMDAALHGAPMESAAPGTRPSAPAPPSNKVDSQNRDATADAHTPEVSPSLNCSSASPPQAALEGIAPELNTARTKGRIAPASRRCLKGKEPSVPTSELMLVLLAANLPCPRSEPSPASAPEHAGDPVLGQEAGPPMVIPDASGLSADRPATSAGPTLASPSQPAVALDSTSRGPSAQVDRPTPGAVADQAAGASPLRCEPSIPPPESAAQVAGHYLPSDSTTGLNLPGHPCDKMTVLPGVRLDSADSTGERTNATSSPQNDGTRSADGLLPRLTPGIPGSAEPNGPAIFWSASERKEGGGTPTAPLDSQLKATLDETPTQTPMPARNGYSKLSDPTQPAEMVGPKRLRALFSPDSNVADEVAALGWLLQANARVAGQRQDLNGVELSDPQAVRAERVLNLVNREVTILKQTSADSMAVLLKPDRHTELLLSVTQLNGRLEAQIRCERGDYTGLNGQWTRLTDALAQQNIHLQPLRISISTTQGISSPPDTAASAFADPERNPSRRTAESSAEFLAENSAAHPTKPGKAKGRQPSRRGWETWA